MITGTFTTAVGDISITMDDGGGSAYVEVSKLGNLKYEFDQTPDSVQIDRTIALYSYIQIVFLSQTESSIDLYTRLVDATATTPIDCTLSIDNFGVDTFDFSFELKQENIDYNEKEGTVAVRFIPKIDRTKRISEVIAGVTNYNYLPVDTDGNDLSNINCLPVPDYLDAAMQEVFGNTYTSYIKVSKNTSNVSYFKSNADWLDKSNGFIVVDPSGVDILQNSETTQEPERLSYTADIYYDIIGGATRLYFQATGIKTDYQNGSQLGFDNENGQVAGPYHVLLDESTTDEVVVFIAPPIFAPAPPDQAKTLLRSNVPMYVYDIYLNDNADDSLKEIAGIEGSIYGTGFSRNFYVHRLSDNDSEYVTLKYDLVSGIKQKKLSKYLNRGVIRQIAD